MPSKHTLSSQARSVTKVRPDPISQYLEKCDRPEGALPGSVALTPSPALEGSDPDIVQGLLGWCARFRTPAVMVGRDGSILWSNEAADALLTDREHLGVRGDRLVSMDPLQANSFRTFLDQDHDGPTLWVFHEDADPLIVVKEIIPGETGLRGLTFHRGGGDIPYLWADFGPALGLTSSEVRIARKLVDGGRAGAIADEVGVGLETVRTHVRRIYNKLGVGSREELFARLSEFRIR